jgi:hypothetical protein
MFPRTNKRKAISTVLTTMIILVASVVLGTGVVIYGTSLFQTGAQSESISTQGVKLWVNSTDAKGTSWGAAAVRNTGDKLESVDTISVRGIAVPYTSWYYANTTNSLSNIQDQFVYGLNDVNGNLKNSTSASVNPPPVNTGSTCTPAAALTIDVDGSVITSKLPICMAKGSGPISLKPGDSAVIYFHLPNGVLNSVDAGASSSVSLYAGKVGAPTTVTIANP